MFFAVAIWAIAILGSLVMLSTREALDRARIVTLWIGGFAAWGLNPYGWTATQVVAGLVLIDAVTSFCLVNIAVAARIAKGPSA